MSPGRTVRLEYAGGEVWAEVGAHGHKLAIGLTIPLCCGAITMRLSRSDALALAAAIRDVAGDSDLREPPSLDPRGYCGP